VCWRAVPENGQVASVVMVHSFQKCPGRVAREHRNHVMTIGFVFQLVLAITGIEHNELQDCFAGLWLAWETGRRVSGVD
jgi:hypothetical protein